MSNGIGFGSVSTTREARLLRKYRRNKKPIAITTNAARVPPTAAPTTKLIVICYEPRTLTILIAHWEWEDETEKPSAEGDGLDDGLDDGLSDGLDIELDVGLWLISVT